MKTIALLTTSVHVYKNWVFVNGDPKNKYIQISHEQDVRGRKFDDFELLHKWELIRPNAMDVLDEVKKRITNEKTQ